MLRCCTYQAPLGLLTLAAEGEALVGLWMEKQRFFGAPFGSLPLPCAPAGVLVEAVCWLDSYFSGARPSLDFLPLAPPGSPFCRCVWREICRIPYGSTVSYAELAAAVGSSPRAVGRAVGHNPIALVIPCHRVVGAGLCLGGYAGGTTRKLFLLAHEGAAELLPCLLTPHGVELRR